MEGAGGEGRYNIFYLYRNSIGKMFVQIANMYTAAAAGRSESMSVNPPTERATPADGPPPDIPSARPCHRGVVRPVCFKRISVPGRDGG